jgi:hypothetical protein
MHCLHHVTVNVTMTSGLTMHIAVQCKGCKLSRQPALPILCTWMACDAGTGLYVSPWPS